MSNLLNKKCALTKLRAELEGRRGKLCRCCKRLGYLAHNCKNRKEKEKGTVIPQNKFEILKSRVMQCGVEKRTIRRQKIVVVKCYKCGEKGHKCREYLLWEKKRVALKGCKRELHTGTNKIMMCQFLIVC